MIASAMMERAELAVDRKRTLYGRSVMPVRLRLLHAAGYAVSSLTASDERARELTAHTSHFCKPRSSYTFCKPAIGCSSSQPCRNCMLSHHRNGDASQVEREPRTQSGTPNQEDNPVCVSQPRDAHSSHEGTTSCDCNVVAGQIAGST